MVLALGNNLYNKDNFYLYFGIHLLNTVNNWDFDHGQIKGFLLVKSCKMIIYNTFSLSLDSTWWSMCQPSTVLTSILDGLSSLVYASASLLWCGFLDTPFTTSSQLLGLSRRWAFFWLKPKHLETGSTKAWAIVYYSITLLNLSHFPYKMSDSLSDVRFLLLFLVL